MRVKNDADMNYKTKRRLLIITENCAVTVRYELNKHPTTFETDAFNTRLSDWP